MTEEEKYEIRDDDGNINFTGEHQLDDTEDVNRVNTNVSDGRSILQNQDGVNRTSTNNSDGRSVLQNQDGGQYQILEPTTIKLAQYFCLAVLFITFLLFQEFIKYFYQQIRIECTTFQ